MRRVVGLVVFLTAALIAIVFAVAGRGAMRATPTYYQDVRPILEGRCTGCHYRGGIAPFALTTYQSAAAHRFEVADAVIRRAMPPWHPQRGIRSYLHDPSLTNVQINTIRAWAMRRAPIGDAAHPAPAIPSVAPHLTRIDLQLPMTSAYTPRKSADADDYRCFVLPWSPSTATYITGVNVTPGRAAEVHHMIVFKAPAGSGPLLERWEAADARAGYGCYGGPSLTGAREAIATPEFVAGWVPGAAGGDLPAGTGVQVQPGAQLILQVHYNLDYVAPRPDRSVVELSLADTVDRRGVYIPLVNPVWVLAPKSFAIPKGQKRIVHTFSIEPAKIADWVAPDVDGRRGFEVHSVLLHMHRLGVNGQVDLQRVDGTTERLLSIPHWSFHWQREYRLAEPVSIDPGDRVSIRCEHDNTARNQPLIRGKRPKPRNITWGENSSDEMCIAFLYVTGR